MCPETGAVFPDIQEGPESSLRHKNLSSTLLGHSIQNWLSKVKLLRVCLGIKKGSFFENKYVEYSI